MAQQADSEIPFGTVDSAEAKQMIDSGEYQVIDVRMPNQFAKAHIPNSVLAPLPELLQKPWEFLADDKIIFVCEVGQSSQVACEIAAAMGLEDLYNLGPGIVGWLKDGYAVEEGLPQVG